LKTVIQIKDIDSMYFAGERDKNIKFIDPPYVRFKGEKKEQETMFIEDPNGNCMEIKTMKNPSSLFENR